jgi:signal transduction histidine kinase
MKLAINPMTVLLLILFKLLVSSNCIAQHGELTFYNNEQKITCPKGTGFYWSPKNVHPSQYLLHHSFQFLENVPNSLSNKDSALWVRVPLDKIDSNNAHFILVPNCHINELQFFLLNEKNQILDSSQFMGDRVAFSNRLIAFPEFIFPINQALRAKFMLLYLDKSNEPFYTSIQTLDEHQVEKRKRNFYLLSAIILGILFAAFIIHIYIVLKSRVIINYLYSIFLALCLIYTLSDFGYLHWIINYNNDLVIDILRPLSLSLAFPVYLFFFIHTMSLGIHFPRATKRIKIYGWIWLGYVLTATAISPFLYDAAYKYYTLAISLLFQQTTLIIVFVCIILSFRKKLRYNTPFFIASCLFIVTHIQYISHRFGYLEDSVFEQHFVPIVLALDCLIIGRIVAMKFLEYIQENKTLALNLLNKEVEISERIAEIQLRELSRISQLLHNHIGIELISLKSKIDVKKQEIPQELYHILEEKTMHLIEDVRNTAHFLSPQILKKFGLAHCLNLFIVEVTKSKNIQPYLEISSACESAPLNKQLVVLLIIQECVNNTIKHAKASEIQVQCFVANHNLYISYSDNGIGTDLEEDKYHGIGLVQIKEMIGVCKGEISIQSNSSIGFQLEANIPIQQ